MNRRGASGVMSLAVPTRKTPKIQVALVGADGAGKRTISQMLEQVVLPLPVKRIYMGVNLEASSLMLPTTRLLLCIKRARGGRPDLVASNLAERPRGLPTTKSRRLRRTLKDGARLTVWMLEEWLRQLVAVGYSSCGYIVVFDRHFFADYYDADIVSRPTGREPFNRLHGWMLQHAYPKPALVICLDAPAEVLFARKPESSTEWLEQRRQQYLRLAGVVPSFVLVDADRPLDAVLDDVVAIIRTQWKATSA